MRYFLSLFILVLVSTSCHSKKDGATKENKEIEVGQLLLTETPPVQGKSHLPRLKASGGKLHMTWVEQKDNLAILKYASFDQNKWSRPSTITSGTDWFVNWADFPALGVNDDFILTNILQKSAEGTYDYDVKLQLTKGDEVIKTDLLLNADGIPAEHGFVSIQAYDSGFYASWLDGRNTKNEDKTKNQMSLRNAYIDLEGNITQDIELDNRICDCCNTATAITTNGPIVVYRDRSSTEPEVRDMSIVRWVDGKWTAPMTIGNDDWQLNGCPVNGPAIDTMKNNVVVTWFTAGDGDPRVMTAFSSDNGETFGTPTRIDSGNAIGRVDTNLLGDGSALVSWLEPQGENVLLQVARVHKDGHHEKTITITKTSADRQSGFPQLEVLGDDVFVSWTALDGDMSGVEMVRFGVE